MKEWSAQKSFAESKIVKSSAVWLILVPVVAKLFSQLENPIDIELFEQTISLTTNLPFSWQNLFFSAVSFTIAGIVYSVLCPELVKKYSNYTQFQNESKTHLHILSGLKKISWSIKGKKISKEYKDTIKEYFCTFSEVDRNINDSDFENLSSKLFNSYNYNGNDRDAFNKAYDIADTHNQYGIWASYSLYIIGFIFIGIVALENLCYVLKVSLGW